MKLIIILNTTAHQQEQPVNMKYLWTYYNKHKSLSLLLLLFMLLLMINMISHYKLILVILVVMLSEKRKEEGEEREREERYWITVMLLLINSLRNPLRTLSTINSNMISIHSLLVCTHSINFLCVYILIAIDLCLV